MLFTSDKFFSVRQPYFHAKGGTSVNGKEHNRIEAAIFGPAISLPAVMNISCE